jgi:hypothetical protein
VIFVGAIAGWVAFNILVVWALGRPRRRSAAVCAWCHPGKAADSHTICDKCLHRELAKVKAAR